MAQKGKSHTGWKGDNASPNNKRARCQRMYPLDGVSCERCSKKATERHHIDTDTGNNKRENVMFLCRSCHMTIDGRMAVIHLPRPKPPQECSNCHQLLKGLRKGVCHTCNEYSRRNNGKPRPEFLPNSTKVTVRHLSIMLELRKQGMTYQDIAVCMKLGRRTVSNAINSIKKEIT